MAASISPSKPPRTKRAGKRHKQAATVTPAADDHRVILARRLDVLAGCELQHGHHDAAEHLARRAAALRTVAL